MLPNKNIWIINHYATTPQFPGGTRHFDFARELVKRGYNITIFASSFHYKFLKETKNYGKTDHLEEQVEGVRFVWVKTPAYQGSGIGRVRNMLAFASKVNKVAMALPEQPDLVIGSSVHLFAVNAAAKIAARKGARFFMEVRDLWPQTLIDMGVSKWHPFVLWLGVLERRLYRKAGKIITLMPKAGDYIQTLGIDQGKIVWISNGVNIDLYPAVAQPPDNDFFTLTYAGAMGAANYLDVLLDAIKIVKEKGEELRVRMVGEGPLKEQLKQKARALKLDNIEWLPAVEKYKVAALLQQADAVVITIADLPLYKYGISMNKIFDYMAAGRPVIFSGPDTNNPVRQANAGITTAAGDAEELAKAVITLKRLSDKERQEMGKRARQHVEEHYSIPVLVDKLEDLF